MSRLVRRLILAAAALALCAAIFAGLVWKGVIRLNHPSREAYPIRGADVSHYQGDIDFAALARQDLSFVFIKATEGASHVDDRYAENLSNALDTSLRVGCYHFFSYDSTGADQAAHFIEQVPVWDGMLPPVIDVEFYGDYFSNPADPDAVKPQLRAMVDALEAHYGIKPILYCTQKAWRLYIREDFSDCDLWIRSVYFAPPDTDWTFWQYTDRAELDGYDGAEKSIDLNVFRGDANAFAQYPG